jgi:hypothetical protein
VIDIILYLDFVGCDMGYIYIYLKYHQQYDTWAFFMGYTPKTMKNSMGIYDDQPIDFGVPMS